MEDTTNSQSIQADKQPPVPENATETPPQAPPPIIKYYGKLATILIYACVLFPVTFFTGEFIFIFLFFLSMCGLILAVAGLGSTLKRALYCSILTTAACLSIWISIGSAANRMFYNWRFTEYDGFVAESIISNTKKADDKQQAIENWCDMLKKSGDVPRVFGSSDYDSEVTNNFVLNTTAAELIAAGEDVPKDMVFLFQGEEGWNQIGGKDKLAASYRYGVVHAVMGDRSTIRISLKKIDRIRWNIDDTTQTLANTSMTPIHILNGLVIAAGIFVIALRRRYAVRYSIAAVTVAAASVAAGYYFSQFGCEALYIGEPSKLADFTTVYIISAVVGAAFILLLAPSITSGISREELFFKIALLGGLCGLAASTLIHIYIMIYKETINLLGILGGAGYGIYAGIALGVITYWLIRLWQRIRRRSMLQTINHPALRAPLLVKEGSKT